MTGTLEEDKLYAVCFYIQWNISNAYQFRSLMESVDLNQTTEQNCCYICGEESWYLFYYKRE